MARPATTTEAGLNFIIIGASVAGLAAAIGLKESGHNVLILEKDIKLGGAASGFDGCARVCPNGSKILYDWGLEAAARARAPDMPGFSIYKYIPATPDASPDLLGINRWNEEILEECRGGYLLFNHPGLVQLLYDKLRSQDGPTRNGTSASTSAQSRPRARVLLGVEVVDIDCEACEVTLASGDVYAADAIIGADGPQGIVRRKLMLEEDIDPEVGDEGDTPSEFTMCKAAIPRKLVIEHGLDDVFYDEISNSVWMGNGRAAMVFNAGPERDLTLWVYSPDSPPEGTWTKPTIDNIADLMGECDPYLQKLASLAGPATCVPIIKPYTLESWVSQSGRVMALGEAAHPMVAAGLHVYSSALEDGLFIGKIFSHTRSPDRVAEFFNAFQEHREHRCEVVATIDQGYVDFLTMPDGEMQGMRDASMRANHAEGRNPMGGDMEQMLEELRVVFGYDASDDAEEWWINWGRYHGGSGTHANGAQADPGQGQDLAKMFRASFASFAVSHIEDRPGEVYSY